MAESVRNPASFILLLLCASWSPTLAAQASHEHHSPYAEEAESGIAGLTAREVEQLANGEGMGLARPAELNRYPGPKHVIEAAVELELSDEQLQSAREIFERMRSEAVRLGREIIDKERTLSRRFEHRHIDGAILRELTAEIGALQGRLRETHLRAHLEMTEVLTADQVERYQRLRGYEPAAAISKGDRRDHR